MKQKHVTLLLLLPLLLACQKGGQRVAIYHEDSHHFNRFFERYNIPTGCLAGALQTTILTICRGDTDPQGNVVAGDTIEKTTAHFDLQGYITNEQTLLPPSANAPLAFARGVDYAYDRKHRITSELTATPGPAYEKHTYIYDDKNRTATRLTYTSTDNQHYTQTAEIIYHLDQNGHIDQSPPESRATDDDFLPNPTSSLAFIETATDPDGAWTTGYILHTLRDNNGNITAANILEHYQRQNTYHQ
ncbi:MAG: hypothetical protein LBI96_06480 [Odoribacteraceae bacterium]|nr:hypothetical protein [Odoribacteraceae bacterium]